MRYRSLNTEKTKQSNVSKKKMKIQSSPFRGGVPRKACGVQAVRTPWVYEELLYKFIKCCFYWFFHPFKIIPTILFFLLTTGLEPRTNVFKELSVMTPRSFLNVER